MALHQSVAHQTRCPRRIYTGVVGILEQDTGPAWAGEV